MNNQFEVSVVISTYNRCDLLEEALESVLKQKTGEFGYEVIVVDNNSTDRTRDVVEGFVADGHTNLRYIFEAQQGISHARNAGIANAQAPLIAFTDDDVRAAPNWVKQIKQAFDEHPEVDFVGGKVVPRWQSEPPEWLTRHHWAPLALVDGGELPFHVSAENPFPLVGANLAFRREVFDRFGFFTPNLQRVKDGIGSTEDHDLVLRLWRAGRRGWYVPAVVAAEVQTERLTKAYHRRWHTGHGRYCAMMRTQENSIMNGNVPTSMVLRLFDVPASTYRELIGKAGHWLAAIARRNESASFHYELKMRWLKSYVRQTYGQHRSARTHGDAAEVLRFATTLLKKKLRPDSFAAASTTPPLPPEEGK